jgi:cytochrome P450
VLTTVTEYDVARPYGVSAQILQLEGAEHAKRRRLWDRAFTPGSLVSYTPMLQARMAQLVEALSARAGHGARVDLAMWIQFLTLDFMGDFAYGGEFNALSTGADPSGLLRKIGAGLVFFSLAGAFPWLRPVLGPLTRLGGPTADIFAASRTVGERRAARAVKAKDLFYYILGEDGGAGEPLHPDALAAEASVGIIAGSDTSGRTLANAMFYLVTHPDAFRRLREEADAVAREQADAHAFLDPGQLADLPFLQAVL